MFNTSELLAAESTPYHGPGTRTFQGTANSNQVLKELFGVQLPGSSFVQPGYPLRSALTEAAVEAALQKTVPENHGRPRFRQFVDVAEKGTTTLNPLDL